MRTKSVYGNEANGEHLSECFSPVCQNENRHAPEVLDFIGAGEGNRTLVFSLEGCCSTIELHPRRLDHLSRRVAHLNRPGRACSTIIFSQKTALNARDGDDYIPGPTNNERR